MAWLWKTFVDFRQRVRPIEATIPTFLTGAHHETTAHVWRSMMDTLNKFNKSVDTLKTFSNYAPTTPLEGDNLQDAISAVTGAVLHGERLLGYNQRLAITEAGSDFIESKEFLNDGDRYLRENRFLYEMQDLRVACEKLQVEFWKQTEWDERFLQDVVKLPAQLTTDFITARNLFSVGFDEIGVLMSGRGFERVMREIARRKEVKILDGKVGKRDAGDADLRDITEVFYRLRWRSGDERVIDQSTKTLLDYVRALRNSLAHPSTAGRSGSWREQAVVIAEKASQVWEQAITSKRSLKLKSVAKDW